MPRAYASFFLREEWQVRFMQEDLKTPLRKKLVFKGPEKIVEMWKRGGGRKDSETKAHLEHAIRKGRGGAYLNPSDEQYNKLL